MNPITHALAGWCLAEAVPGLAKRDRAIVVAASLAPDLDGFGLLPELLTRHSSDPLFWWTDYHHALAHNLLFAIVATAVAAMLSRRAALLAFAAVHLHLVCDLAGSRGPDGYQWPIPYLAPFSDLAISWDGQWALNAWPNIAITAALLAATFVLAWLRGYSPVGLLSERADAAFVDALRQRVQTDRSGQRADSTISASGVSRRKDVRRIER